MEPLFLTFMSTGIGKIERIETSNAILLSGHWNGKILFYAFWLEVKTFLQDTLQKLKLICKKMLQKNPFDLILTGVQ